MLLDPRNGPSFDLHRPSVAPRTWVVASVPRSGSTLLCRSLWSTGLVGAPKEYLNPMQIRDWEVRLGTLPSRVRHLALRGPLLALVGAGGWSDARLRGHLGRVRARRTGPTGWFGLKLHHHHFEQWFTHAHRDPVAWLGEPTWVRMSRADRVGQAISWARALQTGKWASTQRASLPPIYDRGRIAGCLAAIETQERAWSTWFGERDIHPLHVTYEALTTDRTATVRQVLACLGEHGRVDLDAPELSRQADDVTAEWRDRFVRGR